MKKIKNAVHSNKDRIVCIDTQGKQTFYYQAKGNNEIKYLFAAKASPSVSDYFHNKGHRVSDDTSYLTVGELYRFRDYHNYKLTHTLERIPSWVDYVLTHEDHVIEPIVVAQYPERNNYNEYADERAA